MSSREEPARVEIMTFLGAPFFNLRPFGFAVFGSFLIIGLDLASKWFMTAVVMNPPRVIPVTSFFNLVLGFNPGVSFGLLSGLGFWGPTVLSVLALALIVFLMVWLWRTQDSWEASALAIIIGGAAGNLIDRQFDGTVTDFIDLYIGQYHWPAFNFADSAISVGVVMIVFRSLSKGDRNRAT